MLGKKFSDVDNDVAGFVVPSDPDASLNYEYDKTGQLTFDLCATFATKRDYATSGIVSPDVAVNPIYIQANQNWSHDVGRVCFSRTIDPQLLQIFPSIK